MTSRPTVNCWNDSSKSKLEDVPEQSPNDICRNGADEERCISGRIKMAWPFADKKKIEVLAEVQSSSSGSNAHTFKIHFEIGDSHPEILDISPNDEFRLSLKGVEVHKLAHPPKLSSLPIKLVFSKGVQIQWKRGTSQGWNILDTWLLNGNETTKTDNWFFSQDEKETNSEARGLKRIRDDAEDAEHDIDQREKQTSSKASKKRQRKDARRQRRELSSRNIDSTHPSPNTHHMTGNPPLTTNESMAGSSSKKPEERSAITHPIISQRDSQALTIPTERNTETSPSSPTVEFEAGLRSATIVSTALSDIQVKQMTMLIGVVITQSIPRTTRSGEWMRFVHLVDPSNYKSYDTGIKINCFAKRYEGWLPHAEVGDVLILQNVKIEDYQGRLTGVCYHNRLSWAAFSPTKGEFHHGPPNKAPRQEGLAEGGFGVTFSPFFHPGSAETMYCLKLSDWWRNTIAQDPSEKIVIQQPARYQRIHRLISEAGPSVPPDGYFNCTVEVLKEYPSNNNFNRVHTIYVTDYTRNEQAMAVQSNWCHPSLSEHVIQFEMWDAAAQIAATMRPGQYYLINNARMRTNTTGYLEGKVAQNKMVQLFESDTGNVHLQALLERRKKFQAKKEASGSNSSYQLIQDIQEDVFFHCTVELLCGVSSTSGRACFYVTDYTSHPRLTTLKEQPALRALDGRVVKILLTGEQQEVANIAETGSFYCIRNLKLRYSVVEELFCGILGGNDKLIIKLNPNRTDNEHLNGLLRRREKWQRKGHQDQPKLDKIDSRRPDTHRPSRSETRQPSFRIRDIISTECSGRHRIRALPIDFHPLNLQDAFYQICSRCNIEIPKKTKACFKCGDFEHEYVQYYYQLYILVEDEDRQQLMVSIDDKCPLLNGVERTCIQEDHAALEQLRERLKPIIGNLTMVHNALKAGKCIEAKTSEFYLTLEGWLVPGGKRKAFRLVEYEPVIS